MEITLQKIIDFKKNPDDPNMCTKDELKTYISDDELFSDNNKEAVEEIYDFIYKAIEKV
jgi:hypothetical protein